MSHIVGPHEWRRMLCIGQSILCTEFPDIAIAAVGHDILSATGFPYGTLELDKLVRMCPRARTHSVGRNEIVRLWILRGLWRRCEANVQKRRLEELGAYERVEDELQERRIAMLTRETAFEQDYPGRNASVLLDLSPTQYARWLRGPDGSRREPAEVERVNRMIETSQYELAAMYASF